MNNRPVHEDYVAPNVNIFETPEGYTLQAEMPGVGKDGLEITLEGTEITIVGRRTPETTAGEALFRERSTADYRRVFELDPAIDTANQKNSSNQTLPAQAAAMLVTDGNGNRNDECNGSTRDARAD